MLLLLLSCTSTEDSKSQTSSSSTDTGTTDGTDTTHDSETDSGTDSDSNTDTGTNTDPCPLPVQLCGGGSCTFDIEANPVKLSGSVSYNGSSIPDTYGSGYQEWTLTLVETQSGLSYSYSMDGGSDTYKVDVYPGEYNVFFQLNYSGVVQGGITDRVQLGTVEIKKATTYDLAPDPVKLSGVVSYDGASIPDTYGSGYLEWSVRLVDTTSGLSYNYELNGGSDQYQIDAYPGTYDVYFQLNYTGVVDGGITDETRLGTVTVKGNTTYDLAPAPKKLSGAISYDGASIPDTYGSGYQEYSLQLVDTSSGLTYNYELDGGSDTYKVDAYPGTYDVYFQLNYSGVVTGGITDWVKLDTVTIKNNTTLDLAPAPKKLSGTILYDGASIPDTYGSGYQEYSVQLVESTTGLSYTYGMDGGSDQYRIDVYPGTYKVYFRLNYTGVVSGGITDWGQIGTVTVKNNTTYDIKPAPVTLSGNITYNGASIPDTYGSGYQEYSLQLVDLTSGMAYNYSMDGGQKTYSVDVYPGTYDIYFRLNYTGVVEGGITDLFRIEESVDLHASDTLNLRPEGIPLGGAVSYDGAMIPDTYGSGYEEWSMELRDLYTGLSYDYSVNGGSEMYSVTVPAGTYDIFFKLNYSGVVNGGITDWGKLGSCKQIALP